MGGTTTAKETAGDVEAPSKWDQPGRLSIVVQGGLFQGNLIETANHCRHWRELFPQAEIVLALSVTDVVVGSRESGVLTKLRLIDRHRDDGHLQVALDVIMASCDKVALSDGALPLPPIKADSPKLNNMNLQVAAAQTGLSLAGGTYVLRIRSDMVFLDRSFLGQYTEGDALPRGDASVFRQRVLISWLYTLNPYTFERMPLHFSDWFHFGLTQDVRKIWDVPPITLRDSMYYRTHQHPPGSNARERLFNIRLAVEQHVLYHCFKQHFPDLVLRYNNDPSSIQLAMDILVDNFVICDVARAHCVFEKYSSEFFDNSKTLHCITRDDWLAMARARQVDYRKTLAHKIKAASNDASAPVSRDLPRTYGAGHLRTRDGRFVNGEIVSTLPNGLLFFGPYATLNRGRYVATVNVSSLDGFGTMTLRVTIDGGKTLLARRKLSIDSQSRPDLTIPFSVRVASASRLEVVCILKGSLGVAVSGITIAERPPGGSTLAWASLRDRLWP